MTETGQTIIAGMGELHLEIIVDRLLREFKVEANVGAPQVAYKEALTQTGRCRRKVTYVSPAVRGQYGHCRVRFYPTDANAENLYEFVNAVRRRCYSEGIYPRDRCRVFRARCRAVLWPVIRYCGIQRGSAMTVPIMRLTLRKWPLRLPVPWHSRKQ